MHNYARSLAYAYYLETVVGKSEVLMLNRRGDRTNPLGMPFSRCHILLRLPLAVVREKLQLPTGSVINRTMRLSGSNRSDLQVQAALAAINYVTKESVWFTFVYFFFTVKFLQLWFVIFVGEEFTVLGFVREECEKKTLRTTGLRD